MNRKMKNSTTVVNKILEHSGQFKKIWQNQGPFAYALTSNEYPPVLLEPEEWLFSNDLTALLKSLMKFEEKKMKCVKAPFNPRNKSILRPDRLSPWKINHFPEEWDGMPSDLFIPQGHLTMMLFESAGVDPEALDAGEVEGLFFKTLPAGLEAMGYLLLSPDTGSESAQIQSYLDEWEADDREAGLE